MRKILLALFSFYSIVAISQIQLTIEGEDVILTNYGGYNIPRSSPTNLIFRNNILRKNSIGGYVLQCGDDQPLPSANNLDGAIIKGNYLNATPGGGTHGVMLGFNINYDFKYNKVINSSYGLVIEGDTGMIYSSGGVAYNILKSNGSYCIYLFGPDNVEIYNNTFYSDRPKSNLGLLKIATNAQHGYDIITSGTKVKNNIFYAVNDRIIINIDAPALSTLECDYNVYYSEDGAPVFKNLTTNTVYSFAQWQALGFDNHSVVIDPDFIDTENFAPRSALNYGTDLGTDFNYGLIPTAQWVAGESPETTKQGGSSWQVGAVIQEDGPPDVILPSIPTGLRLVSLSESSVNIEWDASTDNIGVVGYNIFRQAILIGTTSELSYIDNSFTNCGIYDYTVSSFDAAGNESSQSETLVVNNCAPDLTSTITLNPNVAHEVTIFDLIVRVTELNSVNTNGTIIIHIPKDPLWDLSGNYDPSLTILGTTSLENSEWTYTENATNHIFTTTSAIPAGGFSIFGFRITFNPGSSNGVSSITSLVVSGGGGEVKDSNNSDSERLDYFQD